jgi:hypothetical protein
MLRISKLMQAVAGLAFALGFAGTAQAQQTTCGVRGSASASPAIYDPFNPSGLPSTNVTLTLTRVNTSGGGDTRVVNFYLKAADNGADGTSIVPISVTGSVLFDGLNRNIFHNFNAPPPIVSPTTVLPSDANRFLKINFTGNNTASDTATVVFQVTLPDELNVPATTNLAFDAFFGCNIQGGQANGNQQQGSFANAIVFPITVLSALQATYAGTALDFGEIGDKTTLEVLAAPATYTTPTTNHIRVRSSGPYQVELESQNTYRMTYPGGNLGTANQRLDYSVDFLNQTRSNGSPTFAPVTCSRAGVPASETDMLPITATLLEGGQGKLVSPDYMDNLTVTVTPLLSGTPSQQNCPAL